MSGLGPIGLAIVGADAISEHPAPPAPSTEHNPVLLGFDVVQYHFIPSYREGGVAVRGKPGSRRRRIETSLLATLGSMHRRGEAFALGRCFGAASKMALGDGIPRSTCVSLGRLADCRRGLGIQHLGRLLLDVPRERGREHDQAENRWSGWFGKLNTGPFNTHCVGHGSLRNWCLSQQPNPWLRELPLCSVATVDSSGSDCRQVVASGGILHKNCSNVEVKGGGVLGNTQRFDQFGNEMRSPYQKQVIVVAAVCRLDGCCCRRRRSCLPPTSSSDMLRCMP